MTTMAYFVGGPWDLSKRALERREDIVYVYEPKYPLSPIMRNDPTIEVSCMTHKYRALGATENGSTIYEYAGI